VGDHADERVLGLKKATETRRELGSNRTTSGWIHTYTLNPTRNLNAAGQSLGGAVGHHTDERMLGLKQDIPEGECVWSKSNHF